MESNTTKQKQLSQLENYLKNVDTEVTMLLQSLQWDRKHLLEKSTMLLCQYNPDHRVPPDKLMKHEKACYLKSQGYSEKDHLLLSPVDPDSETLVKLIGPFGCDRLSWMQWQSATQCGPSPGHVHHGRASRYIRHSSQPCALVPRPLRPGTTKVEMPHVYIPPSTSFKLKHNPQEFPAEIGVTLVPPQANTKRVYHLSKTCPGSTGKVSAPLSTNEESKDSKPKSKLEILAELRDMKRRRTKYRVAAKTRNYSDVLRDVITAQMELYTQAQDNIKNEIKKEKPESSVDAEDNLNLLKDNNIARHKDITTMRKHDSYEEKSSTVNRDKVSRHSGHYKEDEGKKRRYEYTDDKYLSEKYSKTLGRERSKTYLDKGNEHKMAEFTRSDYSRANRRNDRKADFSSRNREKRNHYDDYEIRKRRRDDDAYRRETETEKDTSFTSKYTKTGKKETARTSKDGSIVDKCRWSKESDYRRPNEGHSANIHREKQSYDNANRNNGCKNLTNETQKPDETIKSIKKEINDSYDSDSYSSEDNVTECTETTINIKKEDIASSDDGERESKTYHSHQKSKEKYDSHSFCHLEKDRQYEKRQNNTSPSNAEGADKLKGRRETWSHDKIKLHKDIKKEPLGSSEQSKGDETVVTDHRNRRYDESYSQSFKGHRNEDYERDSRNRRYEHSNAGYWKDERRYKARSYKKY